MENQSRNNAFIQQSNTYTNKQYGKYVENVPSLKTSHGFCLESHNVNHRINNNDSHTSLNNMRLNRAHDVINTVQSKNQSTNEGLKNKTYQEVISLVENIKQKDPAILDSVMNLFKNLIIDNDSSCQNEPTPKSNLNMA